LYLKYQSEMAVQQRTLANEILKVFQVVKPK